MTKNKKTLLSLGTAAVIVAPITSIISCGGSDSTSSSIFGQQRSTLVQYAISSSFGSNNRRWDMSTQAKTMVTRAYYDGISAGLMRTRVTQSSIVKTNASGEKTETTPNKLNLEFDAISKVKVSAISDEMPSTTTESKSVAELNEAIDNLPRKKAMRFEFSVKPGTKYVNSNGEESKYEYKAIDLFYGFLRSIYVSRKAREEGKIDSSNSMPAFSSDYMDKLKKNPEFYENGKLISDLWDTSNSYLYSFFGVDIQATINQNTNTNGNIKDQDKFVLIFKKAANKSIIDNFFSDNNFFTPVPSQKLQELREKNPDFKNKIGEAIQLAEFGAKIGNKKINLSQELLISRFYMNSFDITNGSNGIILRKNKHSYDSIWNANELRINKYQILPYGKGADSDTFAQERSKSFLSGGSESILHKTVKDKLSLMQQVISANKYLVEHKTSKEGVVSSAIINPNFFIGKTARGEKINDSTSKLLFGVTAAKIGTSPTADDEYLVGRGLTFRNLLNASVNLNTYGKLIWPAETSVIKSNTNYYGNSPLAISIGTIASERKESQSGPTFATAPGTISDVEASLWYNDNKKNINIALQPTSEKYKELKGKWKKFINDNISLLKTGEKFEIPILDYRATDKMAIETSEYKKAYGNLITYLNKMAKEADIGDKLGFIGFVPTLTHSKYFINKFETAPTLYSGAGPDYKSIASLLQQLLGSSYGYTILAQIINKVLLSPNGIISLNVLGTPVMYDLNDLKTYINTNYSTLITQSKVAAITLEDRLKFKAHKKTTDPTHIVTLESIDEMAQRFFFYEVSFNKTKVIKYTKLVDALGMAYKLGSGYKPYASLGPIPSDSIKTSKTYSQPWLHVSQGVPGAASLNLVDLYFDKK